MNGPADRSVSGSRSSPWGAGRRAAALAIVALTPAACLPMSAIPPSRDLMPLPSDGPQRPDAVSIAREGGGGGDVELRRAHDGALLVKPRVNGADVGWFALETGARGMLAGSDVVRGADLVAVGSTRLPSGAETTVFEAETVALGPVTAHGVRLAGADEPGPGHGMGRWARGVFGYEVLAGAVAEIDAAGGRLGLYDPSSYELPADAWDDMVIRRGVPGVRCRFEGGGEGVMLLDTGFGGDVWFRGGAVDEYGLLEGRRTVAHRMTRGGYGAPDASWSASRRGSLSWIEIGGHRVEDVTADFSTHEGELPPDASDVVGVVGRGVLSRFTVVLDGVNRRVAFLGEGTGGLRD